MPDSREESSSDFEVAYVIEARSKAIEGELRALLPEADIESGDNFVGGAEIAVFGKLALGILRSILDFVNRNRDRVSSATLKIGTEGIELTGYSAEQAEKLLQSPAVMEAIRKYRS